VIGYALVEMSAQNGHEKPLDAATSPNDTIVRDQSPQAGSSDGEGGERSAREKLKKTSIAGLVQKVKETQGEDLGDAITPESSDPPAENGSRGRPSKKRSFEDLQNDDSGLGVENGGPPLPKKGQHKRMRSREITGDDGVQGFDKEDLASPVQEESDAEAEKSPGGPGVLVEAPSQVELDKAADAVASATSTTDKPALSPPTETSQIPSSSGFANASATSPFGNLVSPKSPSQATQPISSTDKSTSNSAFASSGLSAFASSEKSPFGMVGSTAKTSSGGFGSATGGFGGASPFATKPLSGFGSGGGFGNGGGFGGGFGSTPKPFGTGTTSFAGPAGATGIFGKAKPFGVSREEDDDASQHEEDGDDQRQTEEDAHQDPRFKEQEHSKYNVGFQDSVLHTHGATVETGEEDEKTIFSCRAKLYHFEKEWKERGTGVFKINVRYEARSLSVTENEATKSDQDESKDDSEADLEGGDEPELECKARIIMRTDGVHRVVLNTPVFKDMNVGTPDGQEPSGKTMHLTGLEDGKPIGFQIKVQLMLTYERNQTS
jgi:Ran-binding protein 3